MKRPPFLLKPLFIGVLSVVSSYSAGEAVWTGAGGDGNYTNGANWDAAGVVPDLYLEDLRIDDGQANLIWDDTFIGIEHGSAGGTGGNKLIIGGTASQTGQLKINTNNDTSYVSTSYDSLLVVGESGGNGTFIYDTRDRALISNESLIFKTIAVGNGFDLVSGQSQGTINLLGSGKNLYEGVHMGAKLATTELKVGLDGGSGTVNIDGSSLDIAGTTADYDTAQVFSLGNGANSTGTINVLGGGKLSVALNAYSDTWITPVIGENGGTGTLNISGAMANGLDLDGNPTLVQSRAVFFRGLVLGDGAGSQGNVNIEAGGLLRTYDEATVGKNGGTANVLVTGENSVWNVAGEASETSVVSAQDWSSEGVLTVGSSGGTGTVTIDDSAVVSIGVSRTINSTDGYYNPVTEESFWGYDHEFMGGTGSLNLTDSAGSTGSLIIKGASGKVGVLDAATVNFGDGTGNLIFNHQDSTGTYEFKPELVGGTTNDSFINNISGVTVLNRDNSQFAGQTYINGGTLDVNGILGGDMAINSGGTLTGQGTVGNTVLNAGGTISVGTYNSTNPSVLTINGNYQGNNGTINFNTVLGDDASATDKLVITGDTAGSSWVKVNNLGGVGDQTIQGIELIEVQGASNGTFKQNGRIAAGAYDYFLMKGDPATGADPDNWYLTSKIRGNAGSTLRPEAGSYLGLMENNQAVFSHSFHDRQQTLNNRYKSSWARVEYAHDRYNLGQDNQLNNKVKRKLLHAGVDLYQKDQFHFGVMAGYSKSDIDSQSRIDGFHSKAKSDGYSAGLFATWYDQEAVGGLYVDSYAQYHRFRNKVNGQGQGQEVFNTEGYTFSIESGYGFVVSKTEQATLTVEPQAQLIYGYNSSVNYTERNGTRVHADQKNQVRARAGVRLQAEKDKTKLFLTTNYWNQNQYAAINMDGTKVNNNRAKNLFEAKTGVEYSVNDKFQVFGQVNGIYGKNSTETYGGTVGIKYRW